MRHGLKAVGVALAILVLAVVRAFAGQAVPTDSIDERVRKDVLEALARELDARYAIPDMGKKLAATIKAKQRANAYKSITSGPEFARALTDDLLTVAHDKHLHVNFSFAPLPQQGPPGLPPELRKMNGGISEVRILDGNVGYMKLYAVLPLELARGAVTAAFAFVRNTDALIIDNRSNGEEIQTRLPCTSATSAKAPPMSSTPFTGEREIAWKSSRRQILETLPTAAKSRFSCSPVKGRSPAEKNCPTICRSSSAP